MSAAPSNWDFVRYLLRTVEEAMVMGLLFSLACAAVGSLVALPIMYFVGMEFWSVFPIATVSAVAFFVLASYLLNLVSNLRHTARMKKLRCGTCGDALGNPASIAGGGGGPTRYQCKRCGNWALESPGS